MKKKRLIFDFLFRRFAIHRSRNISLIETTNAKLDVLLRVETILLSEYQYTIINSIRISDEISSTFNFFLLVSGIVITSTPFAINLAYPYIDNLSFYQHLNGLDQSIILLVGFPLIILSQINRTFLSRFVELAKEQSKNANKMIKIKEFYIEKFHKDIDILKAFPEEKYVTEDDCFPTYISFLVILLSSLYYSGAIFIYTGPISYHLILYLAHKTPSLIIVVYIQVIFSFATIAIVVAYDHFIYLSKVLVSSHEKKRVEA